MHSPYKRFKGRINDFIFGNIKSRFNIKNAIQAEIDSVWRKQKHFTISQSGKRKKQRSKRALTGFFQWGRGGLRTLAI